MNDIILPPRPSIYQDLLPKYQDVLFSTLVTSFGLDAIFFANDQKGGNVDTIHNARENVWTKGSKNKSEYDKVPKYNKDISKQYHSDNAYIDKGKEYKAQLGDDKLIDGYTGKELKLGDKFDRDHIISAKEIHEDAGRSLAGSDGVDLANTDSNLIATDRSINRSKQAKTVKQYIETLQKEKQDSLKKLEKLNQKTELTDKERKEKAKIESKLAVNEELIKKADKEARYEYNKALAKAYYLDKKFLGPAAKDVFNTGIKMGLRQGVGIILMEFSFAVKDQIPKILEQWSKLNTWREKLDLKPIFEHVIEILKKAWESIKDKFHKIWESTKDGFIAGVLSSIVTTVINIFKTTARNVLRIIRNLWSAITSSLRIILFNPDNLSIEDKLSSIMKIIAVAIGGILQPIISEAINKLMLTVPLLAPISSYLSEFVSAALSGIISVTLVYFIDNSPLVTKIIEFARKVGEISSKVIHYISEVAKISYKFLKGTLQQLSATLNSPAANLMLFAVCPPLGVLQAFNCKLNRIEAKTDQIYQLNQKIDATTGRIEKKVDGLYNFINTQVSQLKSMVFYNTVLLNNVLQKQDEYLQALSNISQEIQSGFDTVSFKLNQQTIEREALDLQNRLNLLLEYYSRYAHDGSPSEKDIRNIIDKAIELKSWLDSRLNTIAKGDVQKLPFLINQAFALGMELEARLVLNESIAGCNYEVQKLSKEIQLEIQYITQNKKIYDLAVTYSFIIEQYVLLKRALISLINKEPNKEHSNFCIDYDHHELIPKYQLFDLSWNDGLQDIRDIFLENIHTTIEINIVTLESVRDHRIWAKLNCIPVEALSSNNIELLEVKRVFGIPKDVIIASDSALKLLRSFEESLQSNLQQLKTV